MGRAKGRRLLSERRVMPRRKAVDEDLDETVSETPESKDLGFYNPHDGIKGRDGGPYLDYVEREQQEKVRAAKEDREPVTDGSTPAVAGTPLVVASELVDNSKVSNPSRANAPGLDALLRDEDLGEDDYMADPVSVLPVSTGNTPPPDKLDPTKDGSVSASPGSELLRTGDAPGEDAETDPVGED